MSTSKRIDRICIAALALVLLVTVLFMNAEKFGVQAVNATVGYESRLFDTSTVHTIDIVIDDWDDFIENCTDEEYVNCAVVIDGESYKNVGLRAKGNTSLSNVKDYGNDRYSFKLEFDHYKKGRTYYGLDKLCLNNIIQDNTYMKDFLTYKMMADFGVDAPLCSYTYITVNGEDWGLYLAVEGVEDSFLSRTYGNDSGDLYKPDSMSMGGGRGNGKGFEMPSMFTKSNSDNDSDDNSDRQAPDNGGEDPGGGGEMPEGFDGQMPEGFEMPEDFDGQMPEGFEMPEDFDGQMPEGFEMPEDFDGQMPDGDGQDNTGSDNKTSGGDHKMGGGGMGGPGGGGGMDNVMGSSDCLLSYTDDDFDSYSNIFESAKTDVTDSDKERLIASLKQLNENENLEEVLDTDEVIRYFVVHNFVVNFDSYTGSMIHNYYLHEKDGQLTMIPWDYNLAFGGFQSSGGATSLVNYPIDTPVSGGTIDSRPMLAWIFNNEEYTEMYHEYFSEFLSQYFEDGTFEELIDSTAAMIAPYVEKDPTKFCTYDEFEDGVAALREFCLLRAESISGQLDGTIPSTSDGQSADSSSLIDASSVTISDMGSMQNGGGGMGGGKGGMRAPQK
jgi:spore coat protein CotH